MRIAAMPDKDPSFLMLLAYAIAAVCGAIGGCGASAAVAIYDKRHMTIANALAYGIVGVVSGVLVLAFGVVSRDDFEQIARWSLIVAIGVPLVLGGHNIGARFFLKRLGIEVDVNLRKVDKP